MNNKALGVFLNLVGAALVLYALSYFLFPFLAIVLGLALIEYGLKLRKKPSFFSLIKFWFSAIRF